MRKAFLLFSIAINLVGTTPARSDSFCIDLKALFSKSENLSASLGRPLGGNKWEGNDLPKLAAFDDCYVRKSEHGTSYICSTTLPDQSTAQKLLQRISKAIIACLPEAKWFHTRDKSGILFSSLEGFSGSLTQAKLAQEYSVWIQIAERKR